MKKLAPFKLAILGTLVAILAAVFMISPKVNLNKADAAISWMMGSATSATGVQREVPCRSKVFENGVYVFECLNETSFARALSDLKATHQVLSVSGRRDHGIYVVSLQE